MSTHLHVSGTGITGPLARRASGNYKWWVLITAIFGAFVSILDATVVNTALPHIQLAFGTDLHTASYVVTGYLLAQGVVISASGFLANRFRASHLALGRQLLGPSPSRLEVQPQQVQSESSSLWHCPRCGASMVVIQRFTAAELAVCMYFDSS